MTRFPPSAAKAIEAFEREVLNGASARPWLKKSAEDGYSHRWMAQKIGVHPRSLIDALKAWGIQTKATSRTQFTSGAYPVTHELKLRGYTCKHMASSVRNHMKNGMSFQQALDHALECRRKRQDSLLQWCYARGMNRSQYTQVHLLVKDALAETTRWRCGLPVVGNQ